MTTISAPKTDFNPIKVLVIGLSGSGKTGGLVSLLKAGFNVRLLDLEAGVETLTSFLRAEPPEVRARLDWITLTDPMKIMLGRPVPAKAQSWNSMVSLLENWRHTDISRGDMARLGYEAKDLGPVSSWGPQDILVLDTLSRSAQYAFNFMMSMNGKLGGLQTQNEYRRNIYMIQDQYLDPLIALLTDRAIRCNVIVNSHIIYVDDKEAPPQPPQPEGRAPIPQPQIGLPAAIGIALSDKVPRAFNHLLLARKEGNVRYLYTRSPGTVATKTTLVNAPVQYKMETGLADYFKAVRGQ